jgi:ribosomal protein S18 acetylase RimI-like enzyme
MHGGRRTRARLRLRNRILDALEAEAQCRGVRKIVLNARDNAVEFYRKHGYEALATLKRYLA